MSEENKIEKPVDKPRLAFDKAFLERQISESERLIKYADDAMAAFARQREEQRGVLNFAKHLLANFNIPSAPEEKKPDLEAK